MTEVLGKDISQWVKEFPKIDTLMKNEETDWFNPQVKPAEEGIKHVGLTRADIEDARDRLKRWAPYLAQVFPFAQRTAGILEWPVVCVHNF